jgi:hypothetical protein
MRRIHHTRIKPRLPQMPLSVVGLVDVLGVPEVTFSDGSSEGILFTGYCDEMHMIRHQAICTYFDAKLEAMFTQELPVNRIVTRLEENLLLVVTPLRDVVRLTGYDYSGNSWHGEDSNGGQLPVFLLRTPVYSSLNRKNR